MHGKRNDEVVRDLFAPHLTESEVFAHGAAIEAIYRRLMGLQRIQRSTPGRFRFLERHAATPVAVAPNAEPANVDFVLDEACLRSFFRAAADGHQVKRPKPDPEIHLRTMEILQVSPNKTIVLEDSLSGIRAANSAGARVVAVTGSAGIDPPPEADFAIEDFRNPRLDEWIGETALR